LRLGSSLIDALLFGSDGSASRSPVHTSTLNRVSAVRTNHFLRTANCERIETESIEATREAHCL
jgi:hypothetical protein